MSLGLSCSLWLLSMGAAFQIIPRANNYFFLLVSVEVSRIHFEENFHFKQLFNDFFCLGLIFGVFQREISWETFFFFLNSNFCCEPYVAFNHLIFHINFIHHLVRGHWLCLNSPFKMILSSYSWKNLKKICFLI